MAFGPKIGKLFVRNRAVLEYAVVLRFPDTKVIVSGELKRALNKLGAPEGTILVIVRDLTKEAREAAIEALCDIISEREFGWTDASYQNIRQR